MAWWSAKAQPLTTNSPQHHQPLVALLLRRDCLSVAGEAMAATTIYNIRATICTTLQLVDIRAITVHCHQVSAITKVWWDLVAGSLTNWLTLVVWLTAFWQSDWLTTRLVGNQAD